MKTPATRKTRQKPLFDPVAMSEKTSDAYSFDRYASWTACCKLLAARGYTAEQAEAILRSKWMRWAGDMDPKRTYGAHTANTLAEYLDHYGYTPMHPEVISLAAQSS